MDLALLLQLCEPTEVNKQSREEWDGFLTLSWCKAVCRVIVSAGGRILPCCKVLSSIASTERMWIFT